ncbi:Translation initiation factor IF-2 [Fuerstiella marisgermanici]|uniref:Translation initiation factor IF-2 n=1 Tax=Fuerstiella marisgermanici TaxID=1891926 RepID=A0A1P8WSL2_9PLAN|nr:Translation initiation factor IF-2 [Fuerstiella marisgermanici]
MPISRRVQGVVVLKIRIFALARELGLDSKVLLGLCDEAGVPLRNALATITPEEKDQIVAFIKNRDSKDGPKEKTPESLTPTRDLNAGKVRDIQVLPPKVSRSVEEPEPQPEPEPAAAETPDAADVAELPEVVAAETEATKPSEAEEVAAEAVASPAEAETVEAAPVAEEESADTDAPEEEETPEAAAPVAEAEAAQPEQAESESAPEASSPAAKRAPEPAPKAPQKAASPLQRMKSPARREMKPIASVKDREQAAEPPRGKEKPSRPLVAAPPTYQAPVVKAKPKKSTEKAMKPDISLENIVDRSSPLADQLRQLKKVRAEHEGDTRPGQAGGKRQGARKGSLLKELRESREKARSEKRIRRKKRTSHVDLKTSAQIEFPITVRNLSEAIGRPAKSIMGYFFQDGKMVTINDELGEEDALEVAMELGVDLEIKRGRDIEAELLASLDHDDDEDTMEWRPPIITILGHVDHGKTTLVDRLRSANVAAGEAGGITQHIAAYQIEHDEQALTFVDTPGHAAFGEMRARGANVTDIIVLVIAADDGVMPQTEECISHAKNAGVPIIVALNKMDLPEVDDQKTLQQLAQHDMLPSEWGGEYEVIRTSGETGLGLDELVETIQLTAELHEYRANPDRRAVGACLEAFRDEGRGVIAWLIVQKGTLKVGDDVLCGTTYGRIRAIYDDQDNEISEAGPSRPVKVAGLNEVPTAGVHFFVMEDIEEARQVAETRLHEGRAEVLSTRGKPRTLEDILSAAREGEGMQTLPLIVKADSPGSLEAIRGELGKFEHPEVQVAIIHQGVGGVNESDVYLASAADAIIIAFHVVAEDRAEQLAEKEGVEIRRYNIIYEVTEQIRLSLEGMLRPEKKEVTTGRAIVLQTFSVSRFGTIAGCRVINGTISRDNRVHVVRDNAVLNDYRLSSLKREKDDVKEVREGMECGIRLDGFNDVKEGDLLEAFRIDEIQRTLS